MAYLWTAAFIAPCLLSMAGTRLMLRLAPVVGLQDLPGERKVHTRIVPLGGGVAVYMAVMVTMGIVVGVAWLATQFPQIAALLPSRLLQHAPGVLSKARELGLIAAAATLQMSLGLVDDWRRGGLDYRFRLAVELLLVAGLAWYGVRLRLMGTPDWVAGALTVVWVVGLTNAINFLDNMDGLAGGVACLAAVLFATAMAFIGSLFVAGCFVVVAGALAGFLRYNWNPAKIFMGDAGSNFLGFWLGILTVFATFLVEPFNPATVFAPLCILAVPIYDSVSVIVLRLSQGRSPFVGDKQHFSHRLVMLGLSTKSAVLLIYLVTLTTGIGGLLLYFLDRGTAAILSPMVVLQVVCMLGVVALLEGAAHRRARRAEASGQAS